MSTALSYQRLFCIDASDPFAVNLKNETCSSEGYLRRLLAALEVPNATLHCKLPLSQTFAKTSMKSFALSKSKA